MGRGGRVDLWCQLTCYLGLVIAWTSAHNTGKRKNSLLLYQVSFTQKTCTFYQQFVGFACTLNTNVINNLLQKAALYASGIDHAVIRNTFL